MCHIKILIFVLVLLVTVPGFAPYVFAAGNCEGLRGAANVNESGSKKKSFIETIAYDGNKNLNLSIGGYPPAGQSLRLDVYQAQSEVPKNVSGSYAYCNGTGQLVVVLSQVANNKLYSVTTVYQKAGNTVVAKNLSGATSDYSMREAIFLNICAATAIMPGAIFGCTDEAGGSGQLKKIPPNLEQVASSSGAQPNYGVNSNLNDPRASGEQVKTVRPSNISVDDGPPPGANVGEAVGPAE